MIEQQQSELEEAMYQEGQRVPNLTHPDVPSGGEENATLRAMVHTLGGPSRRVPALRATPVTGRAEPDQCWDRGPVASETEY